MRLNQLHDNPGARKARKRVGRGIGSGLGKTSGRGHKGAKSRSGVAIKGFEGGQMPIYRRLPKRGFTNIFRKQYQVVNLGRLQQAIDAGKLDPAKPVDTTALLTSGIIRRLKDGVRLLAKGELKAKLSITVAGASKAAVAAVEKAGGSVELSQGSPAKKEPAKAKKKKPAKSETTDDGEA
jgi:large subunit ribosomal protein L15